MGSCSFGREAATLRTFERAPRVGRAAQYVFFSLTMVLQVDVEMKYRSIDHGPGVSLAAVAILIVLSAAALKYLGS